MHYSNRSHPCVIWFTGLSGAGKSTLARGVTGLLQDRGYRCACLDGDEVRGTISRDLGFSEADRRENIRRIGALARDTVASGSIAVVAAISPMRDARQYVRNDFPPGSFVEVFVDAPLEVCERRDVKGLYQQARQGRIRHFTGIDSIYEPPEAPEIHLRTDQSSTHLCMDTIMLFLAQQELIAEASLK